MEHRLNEYMEQLFPDWTETRGRLDVELGGTALEVEESAEEALRAPVKPELSGRWLELGGQLP